MPLTRLRLAAVNLLIAAIIVLMLIEAMPQSPPALRNAVQPITQRVGLSQGWNVFSPPDGINTRISAEIKYRDGTTATWTSPDWPQLSTWQRFVGHRRSEWIDNSWGQEDAPAWQGWARFLARQQRPDLADADRGAEVKLIVHEAPVPLAEFKPWPTWRTPSKFDRSWTLTIEPLP